MYLTDLLFIEEGNPDTLPDGRINLAKFRLVADILRTIQDHQSVSYALTPVPRLQTYLLAAPVLDDDTLYTLSHWIEPRSAKSAMARAQSLSSTPHAARPAAHTRLPSNGSALSDSASESEAGVDVRAGGGAGVGGVGVGLSIGVTARPAILRATAMASEWRARFAPEHEERPSRRGMLKKALSAYGSSAAASSVKKRHASSDSLAPLRSTGFDARGECECNGEERDSGPERVAFCADRVV